MATVSRSFLCLKYGLTEEDLTDLERKDLLFPQTELPSYIEYGNGMPGGISIERLITVSDSEQVVLLEKSGLLRAATCTEEQDSAPAEPALAATEADTDKSIESQSGEAESTGKGSRRKRTFTDVQARNAYEWTFPRDGVGKKSHREIAKTLWPYEPWNSNIKKRT
ncbi:MAG: hypothetical protein H0S85_06835 [Desulfovibrionaceae bacterium]|jgi:hypothetical protein|nr:hypothetical protein [Desulfovibrionaceae bacterium]